MRPHRLERILRDLNARPTRAATAGRDELEAELLARHEVFTSRERGFLMTTILRKPVLVLAAIALLAVAACTVPTETEVAMGQRLTYTLDSQAMLGHVDELVRFVESRPGVDEVGVNVMETDGGPLVVDLVVWGKGLEAGRLAGAVAEAFPAVATGSLETEDLSVGVKASLAEKLGHEVFDFEITATGTDEEIRAQILEQLQASGFAGTAAVDVNTVDGVTTIGVEMSHEGEGVETEDSMVIELQRDDD
jgi:hypothetical protein